MPDINATLCDVITAPGKGSVQFIYFTILNKCLSLYIRNINKLYKKQNMVKLDNMMNIYIHNNLIVKENKKSLIKEEAPV